MTYFGRESVSAVMLRIRGQPNMERYNLLGWDNLLRGKFSKQWKMLDPRLYARVQRNKKRKAAMDKKMY